MKKKQKCREAEGESGSVMFEAGPAGQMIGEDVWLKIWNEVFEKSPSSTEPADSISPSNEERPSQK